MAEPHGREDMASLYGANRFAEDTPANHSLVLGEVQAMDSCMVYPILNFLFLIRWLMVISNSAHMFQSTLKL